MKVSVVIPTYNRAALLTETLDALLAQSFPADEVIVVDDGSRDSTYDSILKHIEQNLVKYVYQENNGRSSARNRGLELATGDFVMFLDSDDVLLPRGLEILCDLVTRNAESGIIGGGRIFVNDNLQSLEIAVSQAPAESFGSRPLRLECVREVFFPPSTYIVRSDIARELGGFRKEMEPAEDFDFFVRCCQRTKVSYNTDVIVMMRRHDGNTDDRELRKASIRIAKDNLQQGGDASSTVGAHPLWLLRLADDHYALSDIRSFSYYLKALWHGWRGFEAKETRRAVIQACKSLVPGAIRRGLRRGE